MVLMKRAIFAPDRCVERRPEGSRCKAAKEVGDLCLIHHRMLADEVRAMARVIEAINDEITAGNLTTSARTSA
jgi:hypothetical protein